jgi:hypothetical protein
MLAPVRVHGKTLVEERVCNLPLNNRCGFCKAFAGRKGFWDASFDELHGKPRSAVHGDICHDRVGDYSLFIDGWRCNTCGFELRL